jgi:hypothetical protein
MVAKQDPRGERSFDIYSRLLDERIVFLGQPIDDEVANLVASSCTWSRPTPAPIQLYIEEPSIARAAMLRGSRLTLRTVVRLSFHTEAAARRRRRSASSSLALGASAHRVWSGVLRVSTSCAPRRRARRCSSLDVQRAALLTPTRRLPPLPVTHPPTCARGSLRRLRRPRLRPARAQL